MRKILKGLWYVSGCLHKGLKCWFGKNDESPVSTNLNISWIRKIIVNKKPKGLKDNTNGRPVFCTWICIKLHPRLSIPISGSTKSHFSKIKNADSMQMPVYSAPGIRLINCLKFYIVSAIYIWWKERWNCFYTTFFSKEFRSIKLIS